MSDTLSIRKTLILGLGTTGKEVAEAVAEHLTWQFGGFEKAAWVRLLVLETEQPTSLLGDRVLRGGISREEYASYLNAPRTAGAAFARSYASRKTTNTKRIQAETTRAWC